MNNVRNILTDIENSLIKQVEIDKKINTVFQNDGLIVGNGSQDFTQSCKSYYFHLNNELVELIDVPGIEGREQKYSEMIKNAVSRSHLVCFVTRESKQIETNSLEKIAEYLGERVEVLGIQNVSINPRNEYEGESFFYDKLKEMNNISLDLLEQSLLEKIPSRLYQKSMKLAILPGLCGLCFKNGKTTFVSPEEKGISEINQTSLKTLHRQQESFLRHSTRKELIAISGLMEFKKYIGSVSEGAKAKIKSAAIHRLYDALGNFQDIIKKTETDMKNDFHMIKEKNYEYINNLSIASTRFETNMIHSMEVIINNIYFTEIFEKEIVPHIEKNKKINQEELRERLECKKQYYTDTMVEQVKESFKENEKDFFERVKEVTEEYKYNIDTLKSMNVNFPDFEIDNNIEDFFKYTSMFLSNVGLYALSGLEIGEFFGDLGCIIGLVVGVIVGFFISLLNLLDSETKKIENLKSNVHKQLEKQIKKTIEDWKPKVMNYIESAESSVREMIHKTENISKSLDYLIAEYESFSVNLYNISGKILLKEKSYE